MCQKRCGSLSNDGDHLSWSADWNPTPATSETNMIENLNKFMTVDDINVNILNYKLSI